MKSAVITFPGSNCDRDMAVALKQITGTDPVKVWHKDTDFENVDLIAIPGGFSYGDYLRSGAMSAKSPIMAEIIKRGNAGVAILGVCNGFQILTEAGLLPGALMRNASLNFVCEDTALTVENTDHLFTHGYKTAGLTDITVPVAHHDGNYFADPATIQSLEDNGQVLFRYKNNINGAVNNIRT